MNTTHHSSARTCAVSRTRRTGGHATPIGPCSRFATAVEEQRVVGACPHALSMRLMQLAVFLAIRGGACPCADGSGWSTPRCSLVRVRVPVRGGDGSPTHPSGGRLPTRLRGRDECSCLHGGDDAGSPSCLRGRGDGLPTPCYPVVAAAATRPWDERKKMPFF